MADPTSMKHPVCSLKDTDWVFHIDHAGLPSLVQLLTWWQMYFEPHDFVQISPAGGLNTYVSNNVWRDLRLPEPAFATLPGKIVNGKFTAKNDFSSGHFILPLLTLTLAVYLRYLISIWVTCWCNLNKIVYLEIYKSLSVYAKNG